MWAGAVDRCAAQYRCSVSSCRTGAGAVTPYAFTVIDMSNVHEIMVTRAINWQMVNDMWYIKTKIVLCFTHGHYPFPKYVKQHSTSVLGGIVQRCSVSQCAGDDYLMPNTSVCITKIGQ